MDPHIVMLLILLLQECCVDRRECFDYIVEEAEKKRVIVQINIPK